MEQWSKQTEVISVLQQIPDYMRHGVIEYVENGTRVGAFLEAIISNNLVSSFAEADHENTLCIRAYADLLYNHFPSGSWGSRCAYKEWIARKAAQRELAESALQESFHTKAGE